MSCGVWRTKWRRKGYRSRQSKVGLKMVGVCYIYNIKYI